MPEANNNSERSGSRLRPRHFLLLLPYAALCFPVLYARATPELFGFPFFYWYQFVWVVLTSALLWFYYRLVVGAR